MLKVPFFVAILIGSTACATSTSTPERVIDIVANEYAFLAPDTVAAGPAVLRLTNHGKVRHEMIFMKLRPGVSVADLMAAQQRDDTFRPSLEGGNAVLFAPEGATGDGQLAVTLEPGRDYALWCNFRDGKDTPQHSMLGMYKQIHVAGRTSSDSTTNAAVRTVVIDVGDYFFRVADTLAAGTVDLRMTNAGKQRHEVSFGRLKAGASPAFFYAEYLKDHDIDSLYDDDGAILTSYSGDQNNFAMRVQLLPGRSYVLLCEFSDTPTAAVHAKMGMFKGIVVQ